MASELYRRQLANPLWQKKRLEIFERDKFTCQHCNSTSKELHVHHKYYLPISAWQYKDDCYITLCYECHEIEENGMKIIKEWINDTLRINGFMSHDLHDLHMILMDMSPERMHEWRRRNYQIDMIQGAGKINIDLLLEEEMYKLNQEDVKSFEESKNHG